MACLRSAKGILCAAFVLMIGRAASAQETPGKLPVPDPSAAARAERLLHEVYASDYAAAESPDKKIALSRKLLRQVAGNKPSPTDRFVLLEAAKSLAVEAVDPELAFEAVGQISDEFEVDRTQIHLETLQALERAAKSTAQYRAIAENVLPLVDAAAAADRYPEASRMGEIGIAAARRAREFLLARQISDRQERLKKQAGEFSEYEKAAAILQRDPTNAEANWTAGRYLCFVKGDWEKGAAMLALADDPKIKAAAAGELKRPSGPEATAAVGDAWWDAAEAHEGEVREGAMLRAGAWYRIAAVSLPDGLARAKVRNRLGEIRELGRPIPEIVPPRMRSPAEATGDVSIAARLRATLAGHEAAAVSVTFSPDSRTLASCGRDQSIRFWDVATSRQARSISTEPNNVNGVRFSPDGKVLASCGDKTNPTVRLWESGTGRPIRTLDGGVKWLKALAFSPDGRLLASGGEPSTIVLWNPATGAESARLVIGGAWVFGVDFSPDGSQLVTGGADKKIRTWEVATGRKLWEIDAHGDRIWSIVFSPDGSLIASSSADTSIKLWNPQTGASVRTLDDHQRWVRHIAFSPDGAMLASACHGGSVGLWHVPSGKLMTKLSGGWVPEAVAFSPDGKLLAAACHDKEVRLWDLSYGTSDK